MDHNTAQVIQFALVAGTIITSVLIVVVALSRRRPPRDDHATRQIAERLDRIEQAVDSIAIEVERVSEGQRFTSKLLADKSAEASVPRAAAKITTPH